MSSTKFTVIYARLFAYTKKRYKYLILALAGMIIYSLTNAGLAAILKPLLDENMFQQSINELSLWIAIGSILGILLLRGIGNYLSIYYVGYIGHWVVKDLRTQMMDHLLNLPSIYFDTHKHGNILSKFTYDCTQISELASKAAVYLFRDSLTIIVVLAWLFYLDAFLSSIILSIALPIAYVMYKSNKRYRKFAHRTQFLFGSVSHKIQEIIAGNQTVKAANAQSYEHDEFENSNDELRRKQMRIVQTRALSTPLIMILAGISIIIVIYFTKTQSATVDVSIGTIVSFIAAIMILFRPIRNLASINAILQQGIAAAESVFNFLDERSEPSAGEKIRQNFRGDICFKQVALRYPNSNEYALRDIDLTISAGETVALIGHSGAGKSSLVSLLPRLYTPTRGKIEIDNMDINQLDLHDLRSQIAYVGQRTRLIHNTVAENISYGSKSNISDIYTAATRAHAIEFIEKLPQGFDTVVTYDLLSGGQAQRIAIARALLKHTPILIFDEATSALDAVSEKQIKTAIQDNMETHTILIIAHRFSTIDFVKKIVVLEHGSVAGVGSHQALLDTCHVYQTLYAYQEKDGALPSN